MDSCCGAGMRPCSLRVGRRVDSRWRRSLGWTDPFHLDDAEPNTYGSKTNLSSLDANGLPKATAPNAVREGPWRVAFKLTEDCHPNVVYRWSVNGKPVEPARRLSSLTIGRLVSGGSRRRISPRFSPGKMLSISRSAVID